MPSSASISLNHYPKPPQYPEEITSGSGFSVLEHVFGVAHAPWVCGFVWFICAAREFHSGPMHSDWLSRNYIQIHIVVAVGMVSSVKNRVYVYVKLSYTTNHGFMRIFSHTEDAFWLVPCPRKQQC